MKTTITYSGFIKDESSILKVEYASTAFSKAITFDENRGLARSVSNQEVCRVSTDGYSRREGTSMFEFMRISVVLILTGIIAPFVLLGAWFVIIFAPIFLSALMVLGFPLFLAVLAVKLPAFIKSSRASRSGALVIDGGETALLGKLEALSREVRLVDLIDTCKEVKSEVVGSVSNMTPKYLPVLFGVR